MKKNDAKTSIKQNSVGIKGKKKVWAVVYREKNIEVT